MNICGKCGHIDALKPHFFITSNEGVQKLHRTESVTYTEGTDLGPVEDIVALAEQSQLYPDMSKYWEKKFHETMYERNTRVMRLDKEIKELKDHIYAVGVPMGFSNTATVECMLDAMGARYRIREQYIEELQAELREQKSHCINVEEERDQLAMKLHNTPDPRAFDAKYYEEQLASVYKERNESNVERDALKKHVGSLNADRDNLVNKLTDCKAYAHKVEQINLDLNKEVDVLKQQLSREAEAKANYKCVADVVTKERDALEKEVTALIGVGDTLGTKLVLATDNVEYWKDLYERNSKDLDVTIKLYNTTTTSMVEQVYAALGDADKVMGTLEEACTRIRMLRNTNEVQWKDKFSKLDVPQLFEQLNKHVCSVQEEAVHAENLLDWAKKELNK